MYLFLLTIVGPIYFGPPLIVFYGEMRTPLKRRNSNLALKVYGETRVAWAGRGIDDNKTKRRRNPQKVGKKKHTHTHTHTRAHTHTQMDRPVGWDFCTK